MWQEAWSEAKDGSCSCTALELQVEPFLHVVVKNLLKLRCGKGHLFSLLERLGSSGGQEFLEFATQQRDDLGDVPGLESILFQEGGPLLLLRRILHECIAQT